MSTLSMTTTTRFAVLTCCTCGAPFGMEEDSHNQARKKGHLFYCPNGHGQSYGDGEERRLARLVKERERALEHEKEYSARLEADLAVADREVKDRKREIARLARRAAAGVCPCCQRSFVALSRHMKSKHPDFLVPLTEEQDLS